MDIYASQYAALTECIAKSGISTDEISAAGITNQRETAIVWERESGRPIYNAIVWQCRRTADICRELEAGGHADYIQRATGLRPDPYFSGTKIKWILDNVEGARERAQNGELMFGTVDTWLLWKLTDGEVFATDRTNASRTMLYNINTDEWDEKMLAILDIPRCMLPEIKSSSEVYGYFDCMGARIPVSGIAGDQQAALFGQGCFDIGEAKNTYGTGCFLLANTGHTPVFSQSGLLTTVAATASGEQMEYALEGSVFVGGAVIQWLRDEMKIIHDARDSEYFARKVGDSGGVYVVPAFVGLGAPYWDSDARGTVVGLTRGSRREHIIRAALESIAYQTEDVLDAMRTSMAGISDGITRLNVDGGASANDLLLQLQSDFSGVEVARCATAEATAAGAAYLAGLAVGFYNSREDIRKLTGEGRSFAPQMSEEDRRAHMRGWHRAVRACRAFSQEDEE
jgi:glycerol kinase